MNAAALIYVARGATGPAPIVTARINQRAGPPRLSAVCSPDQSAHLAASVPTCSSGSPPSLVARLDDRFMLSYNNNLGRRSGQATRMSANRRVGLEVKVCNKFQPCFLAVERTVRMTAKSFAPHSERNPPEIFWRSFIIRPSRSARLLVKGTVGSVRNRSTSSRRVLRRSSRLWPTRRGGRPRRLVFARAGWLSWNARPFAIMPS